MKYRITFLVACLLFTGLITGQNTIIKGFITDSISGERLDYASISIEGTTIGTTTDSNGNFTLSTDSKTKGLLRVFFMGYNEKIVKFTPGKTNTLTIQLVPTSFTLPEVVIRPGKEKYSKKDNPAVIFAKNVIASRNRNNPLNHEYFQYDHYQKIVLAANDYQAKPKREDGKIRKLDFLSDYVDTLNTGKTILPLSEKEKIETVYYRKEPKSERRVVKGFKSAGVDDFLSHDGVQQFLEEVFHEMNIFQNDIPLLQLRFVSPLSTIGPDYYKYYLRDTIVVDGELCANLEFAPFNSESFGFTGYLFVTLDSTFFVKKALIYVPRTINLNYTKNMSIEQEYKRTDDGTRLIIKDDINVDFKLSEKSKGLYARRLSVYTNQSFSPPDDEDIFKQSNPVIVLDDAKKMKEDFWKSIRPADAVKRNPNTVAKLMAQLRTIPVFSITEKAVSILASGYIPTNGDKEKSKFEIGPANTFISGNAIEGARFRMGGSTTTAFNKRLFLEGYGAYGTKDEIFKYDGLIEYSFNDKKEYRREFPLRSIRAEYNYDINQLGQHYMYTSKDNVFIAWKRQKDDRATYLRNAELTFSSEYYNGIGYNIIARNMKEYSTEYAVFDEIGADGQITPLNSYTMSELEFRFRYAPHEKFYQTRNLRYPITFDVPIFNLSHVTAQKGFLGSSYTYNRTDFRFERRFWFSAFGYVDFIGKAGKVWNKVPYPLLVIPNANLSYTIQPESYTNMNAMEFLSDEYLSWDATYYMNGLILNRLPLIKKLRCREVISFRGLYGNLTDKNNPAINGEGLFQFPAGSYAMDGNSTPYMEMGVGIENILNFIRLDYVWRLTYRDNPNIQKTGVRFAVKFSF